MRAICWRLPTWNPDVASVRYRALIPALHLAKSGVQSTFSAEPFGVLEPEPPQTLVFVKAFGDRDVDLAREASRNGTSVLLDVTDNIFATGYRAHSPENLRLMATVASALVTTGPALRDVLQAELPGCPVHVVPDPVETPEDTRSAARLLRAEWFRRARRERWSELARAAAGSVVNGFIPSLGRHFDRSTGDARPQVLWFGNSGSVEPRFGLVNLADIADELEATARDVPFRLVVASSDRAAYRRMIEPLRVDCEFRRWNRLGIFRLLRESAVVIIPNSRDGFSVCKSANRSVLALSQGTPVVATRIPALESLEGAMVFDDFHSGIVDYIRRPDLGADHVQRAAVVIEREFAPGVIAKAWSDLFEATRPTKVPV